MSVCVAITVLSNVCVKVKYLNHVNNQLVSQGIRLLEHDLWQTLYSNTCIITVKSKTTEPQPKRITQT